MKCHNPLKTVFNLLQKVTAGVLIVTASYLLTFSGLMKRKCQIYLKNAQQFFIFQNAELDIPKMIKYSALLLFAGTKLSHGISHEEQVFLNTT